MVVQLPVKELVVGSNPTRGASSRTGSVFMLGYDMAMGKVLLFIFVLFFAPLFLSAQNMAQNTASAAGIFSSASSVKKDSFTLPILKPSRTLRKGMSGSDVQTLQKYLKLMPDLYPAGSVTGYFGSATEMAIKLLQAREGLVDPKSAGAEYGTVGPKTLATINEIVSRTSTATTTPQIASKLAATSTAAAATSTPAAPKAALPVLDTTPPIRSFGSPSNTLPTGALEIKISLMTNESARCYWSNSPNTPFGEMATPFSTTGGLTHSFIVRNAATGDYAFFVKCRDQYVNTNTSDYPILFSIERRYSGGDHDSPRVFMSAPTNGDSVAEGQVSLSAAAADNAGVAGVSFFLNTYDLNAEDTTPPFGVAVMLEPGAYSTFAVARDADGNRATSTLVAFTVTPKKEASSVTVYQSSSASVFYAFAQIFEWLFRH